MSRLLHRMFLWSWLVTLPITLAGGYWLYTTLDRFHTFGVRYTGTSLGEPGGLTLANVGRYELGILWQRIRAEAHRVLDGDSTLKPVRLFVPESRLKELQAHLPQSGYENVKGSMFVEGKLTKVKYRYRGDSVYRWAWDKKSIRVKTDKDRLFDGMRSFNLLAARTDEQLNNFLSYRLAEMMALIAPRTDLARVYLNGEDRGVHILVEQIKELTLRSRNLMPGDIYRGEIVGKDQFTAGGIQSLFDTVTGWDKVAVNNHYAEDSAAPLDTLIFLLQTPDDPETQRKLSALMDLDAWGRFSAYEALTRSLHSDEIHNWRLYYDPWRQQFQPIVWDTMGWFGAIGRGDPLPIQVSNTLMGALFHNGDFIRARRQALNKVFQSGLDKHFFKLVDDTIEKMERENRTDPYLRPPDPGRVTSAMHELRRRIHTSFEGLNRSGAFTVDYHFENGILDIRLNGPEALDRILLTFDSPINKIGGITAIHQGGGEITATDISGAVKIMGHSVEIQTTFLPNYTVTPEVDTGKNSQSALIDVTPASFRLEFSDIDSEARLVQVSGNSNNLPVDVKAAESIALSPFQTLHFPVEHNPENAPVEWRDNVVISGHRRITGDLHIAPGTIIRFEPDASVIAYGQVRAQGTHDAPILFIPASTDSAPWGTFSLQGRGADGSRFSNCQFSGGSGFRGDMFEYSAMFSIHDVQDVRVTDCVFQDNHTVDDMVHAVYAKIRFERATFKNAVSDALDLDISTADIIDSRFEQSGNDGVDLMTTVANVVNSQFLKNGDKGISVGEGSRLTAINNRFTGNHVGVQSKDRSVAILYNATLTDNDMALHVYRKNWQYGGGGEIFAAKSVFSGNKDPNPIAAGKRSKIGLFDSYNDRTITGKRVYVYDVDHGDMLNATSPNQVPDKIALTSLIDSALQALSPLTRDSMALNRRGARFDD